MNKKEERKKLLRNLARVNSESALTALAEQAEQIGEVLKTSDIYERLDYGLDLLDIIIIRVPERGMQSIKELLHRLPRIELKFEDERRAVLADNLTTRALSVLSNLRYSSTAEVITILFNYLSSDDKQVSSFCRDQLNGLAGFNITALKHVGIEPQRLLLDYTVNLPDKFKASCVSEVSQLLAKILDLTATDTKSDYQSVAWHTGVVPVTDDVIQLRSDALEELRMLYSGINCFQSRMHVLSAFDSATSLPRHGDYGPKLDELIKEECTRLIEFYDDIANQADVTELETIEKQINFLKYRDPGLASSALTRLEEKLASNKEYGFYRALMAGYDAFPEYRQERENWSFEKHRAARETLIDDIVQTIDATNFDEWSRRIISIRKRASASTSSQFFEVFLKRLSHYQPELMLTFASDNHQELDWFVVPVLSGLWSSSSQEKTRELLYSWASGSHELTAVTNFLSANNVVDKHLVASLLERATAQSQQETLRELVGLAASQFKHDEGFFADLLVEVVGHLSGNKAQWPHLVWFQEAFPSLVAKLKGHQIDVLLSSLEQVEDVSFEVEEVLQSIASRDPSKIVPFFEKRLMIQNEERDADSWSSHYDAIPFKFYRLDEELVKHAELIFDQAYAWFERGALWEWEAARFIHNIFADLSGQVEEILLSKIVNGSEKDSLNVLTILKEYEGDIRVHDACKEVIKRYPGSKRVRSAALIALDATGVVSGQFGLRDAHVRKKEETKSWLDDNDPNITDFAAYYHEYLDERIEEETIEGERDLEVRKKVHGVRQDEA